MAKDIEVVVVPTWNSCEPPRGYKLMIGRRDPNSVDGVLFCGWYYGNSISVPPRGRFGGSWNSAIDLWAYAPVLPNQQKGDE